jgi:4-carboxymuconolactone decarboxylase
MLDRVVARAASVVTGTEPPRIFTELGRHPRLFRSWLPFAGVLLWRGALPRTDTELVILRTAWNCGSRYEWVQHVGLAGRAGLSTEEIAAVPDGDGAGCWSERQRWLLRATDELHRDRRIGQETDGQLERVLRDREQIELCMLVGHYEMLAMVLNTRHVDPEPTALARISGRAAEIADAL